MTIGSYMIICFAFSNLKHILLGGSSRSKTTGLYPCLHLPLQWNSFSKQKFKPSSTTTVHKFASCGFNPVLWPSFKCLYKAFKNQASWGSPFPFMIYPTCLKVKTNPFPRCGQPSRYHSHLKLKVKSLYVQSSNHCRLTASTVTALSYLFRDLCASHYIHDRRQYVIIMLQAAWRKGRPSSWEGENAKEAK